MIEKPGRVLELVRSQLLFRRVVHLRIIEFYFGFTRLYTLSVGKLYPVPIRLVIRIGFRDTRYYRASSPATLNNSTGRCFTTSNILSKEKIMSEQISIVFTATKKIVHFHLHCVCYLIVFNKLSEDVKTRMILVSFFDNYGTTIITSHYHIYISFLSFPTKP